MTVARCFEGEQHLPYGPFVAGLRALVAAAEARLSDVPETWWAETARVLPELGVRAPQGPSPAAEGPGAQARLLDAVTGLVLAGLSGEPPGLLVIDDVHWADSASLALLTYLARRLPGAPVGIALAWRSEAVPPDDHLRRLAAETSCPTTRLMLDRLARPEVDRLIGAREPHVDEATRARLWEETEGVPLFVVEYLAAIGAGPDVDEWTVSSGVRDLVSTRLGSVDEAARQLLNHRRGDRTLVPFHDAARRERARRRRDGRRAGRAAGQGSAARGAGERRGAGLRLHASPAARPGARRRLLHRRVAAALEEQARGRRGTAALRAQVAWHLQQACEDEAAAEHYARAGESVRAVHAKAEALTHFEAALALGHPDEAGLHEAIGDLHTLAGRYGATRPPRPSHRPNGWACSSTGSARSTIDSATGSWPRTTSARHSTCLATKARGAVRVGPGGCQPLTLHRRGDPQRALDLAEQALALAEQTDDPRALAQAHNLLGVLATSRGDVTSIGSRPRSATSPTCCATADASTRPSSASARPWRSSPRWATRSRAPRSGS